MVRIVIVDDEPLARKKIRRLLKNDPELEIVGEYGNGQAALTAIQENPPDVLLLDIQMPEMDGLQMARRLPVERTPYIIFVTAYDRFAVQAFEVHALDYVLKPYDGERLQAAVNRAKTALAAIHERDWAQRILSCLEDLKRPVQYLERIPVKRNEGVYFIKVPEIDWIESEGNYLRLHTGNTSHLMRETLSNLEAQLNPQSFIRIQRSVIVNFDRIREISPLFHGDCRILLFDGTELTLSRLYRHKIPHLPGRIS
ncbi:MAG: LytTR family DNA-binding domain-containing protein [Blastocatellia bacterium]|nr:LytTR family DNA-binding domain-containing protein [Blastocatellia bacterium]